MPSWSKEKPCESCGATTGSQLQCNNCVTLGCKRCFGGTGRRHCKFCKKMSDIVKL